MKHPELLFAEAARLSTTIHERKESFDRRVTRVENQAERLEMWRQFLDANATDLARHIQITQLIEALMP